LDAGTPTGKETDEILAAGFLLSRPLTRPEWFTGELLPDRMLSASPCICPQFPGEYAISWCSAEPGDRASGFDEIGIPSELRDEALEWATRSFEVLFGWPGVFFTLEAAQAAHSRFFAQGDVAVLGLGLPGRYREEFLIEATPPPPKAGFAPTGESGWLKVIRAGKSLPAGGTPLGFELLSAESGLLGHSWLCNGLERIFAERYGVRPNAAGFIESLEDAVLSSAAIETDDLGAEPGPWFPWLIVRYETSRGTASP